MPCLFSLWPPVCRVPPLSVAACQHEFIVSRSQRALPSDGVKVKSCCLLAFCFPPPRLSSFILPLFTLSPFILSPVPIILFPFFCFCLRCPPSSSLPTSCLPASHLFPFYTHGVRTAVRLQKSGSSLQQDELSTFRSISIGWMFQRQKNDPRNCPAWELQLLLVANMSSSRPLRPRRELCRHMWPGLWHFSRNKIPTPY